MQIIIEYGEKKGFLDLGKKIDKYQNIIINPYIQSYFFPWVCLILLLNRKNWKRKVIFILVGHWFLRSTGTVFINIMDVRKKEPNMNWPYSKSNWLISNSIASLFWLTGEILGDLYPLLRIKAVTNNHRKIRIVYVTCILYNITKVIGIIHQFSPIDLRILDENRNKVKDIENFRIKWWEIVFFMQLASCLYDLSVIYSLKNCLFNKLKEYKNNNMNNNTHSGNSFMNKFKQISEFRIILSMVITLLFIPILFIFVVILNQNYNMNDIKYINLNSSIEQFRQVVLSFNFTFMYIDQILLRCFVEKNQQSSDSNKNSNKQNWNMNDDQNLNISINSNI
eukprot:jgi/Orpsp1_1/1185764/evm.model.c7180000095126.1